MELLDINLTKNSSLLLHDIHSSFYWRILKKTRLLSGFQNYYKNIREIKKLVFIHVQHFLELKNEGRKPDKNSLKYRSRIPSLILPRGQVHTGAAGEEPLQGGDPPAAEQRRVRGHGQGAQRGRRASEQASSPFQTAKL
jgi:hypothetical protein